MKSKAFAVAIRLALACLCVLLPSIAASHPSKPQQPLTAFHPTIIEAPDGASTAGADINNSGVVIGYYSGGTFAWSPRLGFNHLAGSENGVLVRAINECNEVVGEGSHALLWRSFDEVEDLGSLGGTSGATDINDRGEVVGYAHVPSGKANPMMWTAEQGMQELFDCGPLGRIARGINNRGEVVGRCNDPASGGDRAFYWSKRTGKIEIVVPGFILSDALGINELGEVVGVASTDTAPFVVRGFAWTRQGGAGVLRDLGQNFSFARFNNNVGWKIGEAVDASGIRNSVLWITRTFGFQIHPGFGIGSEVGGGLNDRGDLLDTVTFGPSNSRAVVWQPARAVSRFLGRFDRSRCLRERHSD